MFSQDDLQKLESKAHDAELAARSIKGELGRELKSDADWLRDLARRITHYLEEHGARDIQGTT
jgi:hypothetical protein